MHWNVPLVRRGSGLVKTSSVGMFAAKTRPSASVSGPPTQRVSAAKPMFELGTRPSQLEPAQAELRQSRRAAAEGAQVVAPALRPLSVLVGETGEVEEVSGEPALGLQRFEVGVDLTGPVVGGPGRDHPPGTHVQLGAAQEGQLLGQPRVVGRDPLRRDAVEVPGFPLAGDVREGAARACDLPVAAACPRRERAERVVVAVQEPRAHHERIRCHDVYVTSARPVRRAGDGDEQLPMLGLALDDERVVLLDAEAGAHDRVGVARKRLGR